MLFTETLHPETLALLRRLQSLEELSQLRLVGGTALALQLGHRKSIDLDLFGNVDIPFEELNLIISEFADVQQVSCSKRMCFLIVNGVKVDIVNYPYQWIDEPIIENGLVLAGVQDIAAMKLSAITNRGTKKDFIDYFFLLKKFSLLELIDFYKQKYPNPSIFSSLKSLVYFADAEQDPMPVMLKYAEWDDVKKTMTTAVEEYLQ